MRPTLVLFAALASAPTAAAQQPGVGSQLKCGLIVAAIETGLRRLAFATYSGAADNSAVRQQVRELMAGNALSSIQANLHQLEAHRCPPYELPITPDLYEEAARKCESAVPSAPRPGAVFTLDPCDVRNWKRNNLISGVTPIFPRAPSDTSKPAR